MSIEDTESTEVENTVEDSQPEASTEAPQEEQPTEGDSFTKFNLNDVDENIRSDVEKAYKSFQSDYTRKTQALAEERKVYEGTQLENDTLRGQIKQVDTIARDMFSSPERYEHYRKQYGPSMGVEQKAETPEFETTEDIQKYLTKREQQIDQRVDQKVNRTLKEHQEVQRWDSALGTMRSDPLFKQYENFVAQMVSDERQPYRQLFSKGHSEKQVLEKAFTDFKTLIKQEREQGKTEAQAAIKTKKQAQTQIPSRSIPTEDAGGSKKTDAEIIADVNKKLGDW